MHTQPLFLDTQIKFEHTPDLLVKSAGMLTPLSDNTEVWPQEITQAAYEQLPFLSNFEVNVAVSRLNEEHGYAIGVIQVRPRSDMMASEMEERPLKEIQVPFIVREKNLAPLDVYIQNGEYKYLTEGRARGSLFRPDAFDASRERPPEPSLYQDLQPPMEAQGGFGAMKTGSALLPQLHGRVNQSDLDRLSSTLQDPSVKLAFANASEGVRAAIASAQGLTPSDPVKFAADLKEMIPPNVVQFKKTASGRYFMKQANSDAYAPQEQEVTPDQVQEMLGGYDLVPQLESDGSVTVSPDATIKQTLEAEEVRAVDQPGLWLVQDINGTKLTGWAFPQILTLQLIPLPLTLFSNGSQFALQQSAAGRLIGKSGDVPRGAVQGYGCLYYLDHGTPKAFLPMSITATHQGPDGRTVFQAQDDADGQYLLSFIPGIKVPTQFGPNEWAVPDFFKWMPLRGQTQLVESPVMFTKISHARLGTEGEIISNGSKLYSFRGAPFDKLAQQDRTFLEKDAAIFLAAAVGVDPSFAKEAMKRADVGKTVKLAGLKTLHTYEGRMEEHRSRVKTAMADLAGAGIKIRGYNLVKEATVLDDALTADKILGLGFLNPENVSTFVDLLPGLEYASSKIAEMLVASRIGMKDIPEVALERMLVALEDVIQGLRALKQRDMSFSEA
jgi:hypothetical protein